MIQLLSLEIFVERNCNFIQNPLRILCYVLSCKEEKEEKSVKKINEVFLVFISESGDKFASTPSPNLQLMTPVMVPMWEDQTAS